MQHNLETNYNGAILRLVFSTNDKTAKREARLLINNIDRDQATSKENTILKLNSTVQTEYEFHEFIEATVEYDDGKTIASLYASKVMLKQIVIERRVEE
ncbi:MAG: hypothetical protein ACI9FB_000252 [Candidatus Azotimanducaceae bacterium]|jgi:hypothetical protein